MSIDFSALMPAVRAARAEAERLGIPVLDDRILTAYRDAALPILREQLAQKIEAENTCCDVYRAGSDLRAEFLRGNPGYGEAYSELSFSKIDHEACYAYGEAAAIVRGDTPAGGS